MDEIVLEDIKIYAFHGCMKEETRIGSDYIINLNVKADLKDAAISDQLKDTVNYVDLLKIVNEEMAINSKLLEHVAERIVSRILLTMKMVNNVQVKVAKQNPPINGNISAVTIIRKGSR
jgi:dihydroneopterin aldolase